MVKISLSQGLTLTSLVWISFQRAIWSFSMVQWHFKYLYVLPLKSFPFSSLSSPPNLIRKWTPLFVPPLKFTLYKVPEILPHNPGTQQRSYVEKKCWKLSTSSCLHWKYDHTVLINEDFFHPQLYSGRAEAYLDQQSPIRPLWQELLALLITLIALRTFNGVLCVFWAPSRDHTSGRLRIYKILIAFPSCHAFPQIILPNFFSSLKVVGTKSQKHRVMEPDRIL